ncbi:MAG: DUF975 family protein [Candidatus Cryptobacteroides sp.]
MSNQEYKNSALRALSGNWAPALIATIVYLLVTYLLYGALYLPQLGIGLPSYASSGVSLVILLGFWPFMTGFENAFRLLFETGDDRVLDNSFSLGFGNWLHIVWGMLLTYIFIFLWALLFIIPGIVKSFSYAMTPYILVEHPEMSANQAIDESRRMMRGHKFDLFYLYLSFIGWWILAIFTAGIGFIWLVPYMECAKASFYADLKSASEPAVEAERVL